MRRRGGAGTREPDAAPDRSDAGGRRRGRPRCLARDCARVGRMRPGVRGRCDRPPCGGRGGHLLVSASLTLGVHIRPVGGAGVLAALAYDAGANVLAAECLFRGALFNRAQRRWSFATALLLATAAYVARYLVDPLLPKSVEWVVGAVFYLTLLSAGNCWLFWWSGSLVPGVVSALVFFAAYRLLGTGG